MKLANSSNKLRQDRRPRAHDSRSRGWVCAKVRTMERRDFLKIGSISTVALTLGTRVKAADQDAAGLPNAKQAKPITREEYLERQETARKYMKDAGISGVLLT